MWHVAVKMNAKYDYALFKALTVVGRRAGGLPAPKPKLLFFGGHLV